MLNMVESPSTGIINMVDKYENISLATLTIKLLLDELFVNNSCMLR